MAGSESKSESTPSAAEARRASEQRLTEDRRRWAEITPLTEALKQHRINNHFSERIARGWRDTR